MSLPLRCTPPRRSTTRRWARAAAIAIASLAWAIETTAREQPDGKALYESMCVRCHAADGAGVDDGPGPLSGELSVAQLADVIAETMPEDDPGVLSREEANAVAAYVHDAFYSAIAQARNQPARVELMRLTVAQYRRAVADLVGSFGGRAEWGDARGLTGQYFTSREPRGDDDRAGERLDAVVDFDFGVDAPLPDIKEPHKFSIRWEGSVRAAETGEYRFVVRSDHAVRLWVNDLERALIDRWVKSGDESQFEGRIRLLGGRVYPLRLEFSKAKLGVDDSDKEDKPPPSAPASIALLWQRPHGALEVLPARHLSPSTSREAYVCTTPFPPDDRSLGWERGTSVSKEWDQATTAAAIETATYVGERLDRLARTREGDDDREQKLREFCRTFVERAFRQPLDDELVETYVDDQFAAENDPEVAVRRVVLLALKSPRFLFREIGDAPHAYHAAARLSFGLWDSLPDRELLEAARRGQLSTDEDVRRQGERLLADYRADATLHEFLLTWLKLDGDADLGKDPERFPECDDAFLADLRTSLELFLDEVIQSDAADFRTLLLDDEVYLNGRLAEYYGAEPRDCNEFAKVKLDDGRRAGVLTHPYVMARFAYSSESSPIHRGVFLARGILGQSLRPPPEAFAPLAPDLHPDLTTRERVSLQTKSAACMTCHRIINPLGFTLEHFDAVGRYRDTDRDEPIDDSGAYQTRTGETVELDGAHELAEFVAESKEGQAAFVEQLFHRLVQQPVRAFGPDALENLRRSFEENDFNIRLLAREIMVASVLAERETGREPEPATTE